jgi:hypothetical protein
MAREVLGIRIDACPQCGRDDLVVPILYGLPTGEAMEAAERGEISIAGCMVGDDDSKFSCKRCSRYFGLSDLSRSSRGRRS